MLSVFSSGGDKFKINYCRGDGDERQFNYFFNNFTTFNNKNNNNNRMKCLSVFSSKPELLFLWCDSEFKAHLTATAARVGLGHDPDDPAIASGDPDELIQSYANHFFAPIVTSNCYMRELNNSYQSVLCEDGFIFCMSQLAELFFIAVSSF